MARVNKSQAPYYDDYDRSKQYTQLLAVPGRVAQAREITQIQTTVKDIVKSLGDSLLRDGNIIEGCQVIVNSTRTSCTVTAGKVYLDGLVLPVIESTVAISGSGTELVGAKLMETLMTEDNDNTLRDPAQGYDNYNQAGCHRIKSWIAIVVNDPEATVLATLIDGSVSVEVQAPTYDILTQTLARRTYDESGSYVVNGLNVRVESNASDTNKFNVVIEAGKAYVLGYELRIPAPRRLATPRSLTYSPVTASNYIYDSTINTYPLSSAPYVKQITSVQGSVSKTVNQTITSNTDSVLLDELTVSQITSVSQGGTSYTVGTSTTGDCYLQREGTRYYLKWNGTANYPNLNTSYSVTYTYLRTFTQGTDYRLSISGGGHNLVWISEGSHPLNNTPLTVTYEQYLARKDIVYIDQYGSISLVQGIPAENGFATVPDAPVNTLPIAVIDSPPGGDVLSDVDYDTLSILVNNVGLTRFTMNDIQKLLNRVRTLEYDQSVLSLNEVARQFETTNTKRGIFTDPLIDFSKVDVYYNLSNGVIVNNTRPTYDVALDLHSNTCYLPVENNMEDLTYSSAGSTVKRYGRIVTLGSTGQSTVLSQMRATKSFLINPYTLYPQVPEVTISPAVDNWVNDTIISVPVSQTSREVVNVSTRNLSTSTTLSGSWSTGWDETSNSVTETEIGTKVTTSTSESVVSTNSVKYIRTREITVEGSGFSPNLNNIECHFDGIRASLTATGTTTAGTVAGTVRSNASGIFTAKFTIPSNILTGLREVRFSSSIIVDGYENSAFAMYQASGVDRSIQRTVTTLSTILVDRVTTVTTNRVTVIAPDNVDPVGQTFILDKMKMLSGIDLYFEAKPIINVPVTCDIREVVNGTITSTVYGHKTLPATSVNVSSNASVATRFDFDDPVLLEGNKEYAFVVRSTSPSYKIWIAELGETDVQTGDLVLANPYLVGLMMSSSNNSSWTNHQTSDIKFRLIADTYSNSSDLLFTRVTGVDDFSRIYLLADGIVPNGSSITWSYSLNNGTTYVPISPYHMRVLDQLHDNILIKATLSRTNDTELSPMIAIDSIGVSLSCYDSSGYYITKNITGLDAYTHVDIVLDTYIPSNTSIKVYVSRDNGTNLVQSSIDNSSVRTMNYGWKEQTYRATVSSATQCRVFIKLESDYAYFTPAFRRVRVIMS